MRYQGGKVYQAKDISYFINLHTERSYWEPFCGGCAVTEYVKLSKRYASDINGYLIAMWKALQRGWEPPERVSVDLYNQIKDNKANYPPELVAFVGFGCSFGGKWLGGYARGRGGRNYTKESRDALMASLPRLQNVQFFAADFMETDPPEANMVIYCDPPYKGVTSYHKSSFDTELFWERVRELDSQGHVLYISEFSAPDDFDYIWSKPRSLGIRRGDNHRPIEKLWVPADSSKYPQRLL